MSKDLKVTSDEHVKLAGRIQDFHDELQSRITSLNGVVDRIQAGWQGAASQEYDKVQHNMNLRLKSMRADLVQLEEIMRMSADGFTQEEEDRISAFRKMDDTPAGQSKILGMA
ncbi:WXG100 family type VII secretion target [Streptomyces sp. SP18CS02]|uniref:WXG100 family type VII secretion target n=1 Tax=Streptomyces sp. SP18CS02 TaxID=3002531 RepID=UPI002E7699D9|nr:WXG100 family type VII secretion target [Streptomyces sp. SP18CS02]MEE1756859.1 WXG100 family type VII secretion target [Streptomyces sp. SP18CS02]